MKKKFLLLGLLAFVAFFISSCSQEDVVNDTKGASPESVKVEKMTNLFKTYNWNLDTTIPEKKEINSSFRWIMTRLKNSLRI